MDRDRELHEMADEGRALMRDYIKREDALELFEMLLESYKDAGTQNISTMVAIAPQEFNLSEDKEIADFNLELDGWRNDFMKIESADVAPFNHAHWIKHEGRNGAKDSIECSACGVWIDDMPRKTFCPNCGSIMYRYGEDNDD